MGDKRRRDPEGTRQALLDAALAEFAEHGRAGARTSAIAARAGVNKQLISHHFGGKDGLYRALVERWLEEEQGFAAADTPLAEVLAAYAADARRNRDLHRLLLRASLEDEADDGAGPDEEALEDLRRRSAAGELTDELDPAFVLLLLQAVAAIPIVFPGDARRLTGREPSSPRFARWHAEQARRLVELLGPR